MLTNTTIFIGLLTIEERSIKSSYIRLMFDAPKMGKNARKKSLSTVSAFFLDKFILRFGEIPGQQDHPIYLYLIIACGVILKVGQCLRTKRT